MGEGVDGIGAKARWLNWLCGFRVRRSAGGGRKHLMVKAAIGMEVVFFFSGRYILRSALRHKKPTSSDDGQGEKTEI